jgi:hypothetical protein
MAANLFNPVYDKRQFGLGIILNNWSTGVFANFGSAAYVAKNAGIKTLCAYGP